MAFDIPIPQVGQRGSTLLINTVQLTQQIYLSVDSKLEVT